MKFVLSLVALAGLYCSVEPKITPPKVVVYSRDAGEFGKTNTLICHVSGFHPPDISIKLMKNHEEIPSAVQTDLAFKRDWHFHLTKNVEFTPQGGDKYSCKVTHGSVSKDYAWVGNM